MAFVPGSAGQPTSELELTISCRSLQCKDVTSKSDPMCVTYVRPFGDSRWVEFHRTEVVENSHDPNFASKIHMLYKFEEQQALKFEVYDVDSSRTSLSDHEFLGWASCNLAQIVTNGKVQMPLAARTRGVSAEKYGYIIISGEELLSLKDEVVLKFSGSNLDKKDFFGKSDPFLEIFKSTEAGDYTLVHRTEVIKNTLNPVWREFVKPVRALCNGDYDRNIKVVCYDWNGSGDHSLIGQFFLTLKQIKEGEISYKVIHPEKQARKGEAYKGSGSVTVDKFEFRPIYTFMDYLRGGTQINCTFAIDFTASNGHPQNPNSLHLICEGRLNSYEQAIVSVGSIIEDYDSDKQFPVLGFGARIPPAGEISHEFFVNFHPSSPYCTRVQGVLDAYRGCIRQIQLYGPTNFAPVINHVARFAANFQDGSHYFILLIITDGVITDMAQTCSAIVNASVLPMSIIIVGVGGADFSAMEELDGDTVALSCGGSRAARDIVQFVPFSRCMTGEGPVLGAQVAKELLAEVPRQVVEFMLSRGIFPRTPDPSGVPFLLPPDPEASLL